MAQQVVIAGAMFNDVPAISVPDANNVYHSFLDTTIASNAAQASDIASGKLAYVNGSLVTGTNSGGGGGLEYESGTWTPSENVSSYFITFSNAHTSAPFFYVVCDAKGTYDNTSNTIFSLTYYNYEQMGGIVIPSTGGSPNIYGEVRFRYRATNSSSTSAGGLNINNSISSTVDSSSAYPKYWAKSTGIRADTTSTSRYWRTTHTYKWIAVWAPIS